MSYLAKFSKIVNGEKNVFHKWVKSDFNYTHTNPDHTNPDHTNPDHTNPDHTNPDHTIHSSLMQKLDDEQLEGSGFVLNCIVNVILEI